MMSPLKWGVMEKGGNGECWGEAKETFIYICNKGYSLVICGIALHQQKFFLSSSRQKSRCMWPKLIGCLETGLYVENLCQKYCFVVIACVKIFKMGVIFVLQIQVHLLGILFAYILDHDLSKQSKACLLFSYFHQFLEYSWGRCKSMGTATVPCVSFCGLWHWIEGINWSDVSWPIFFT